MAVNWLNALEELRLERVSEESFHIRNSFKGDGGMGIFFLSGDVFRVLWLPLQTTFLIEELYK